MLAKEEAEGKIYIKKKINYLIGYSCFYLVHYNLV